MLKGEDAVVLTKEEYAAIVNRSTQLEEVNDSLNDDVTRLSNELAKCKEQTGQGVDWNDFIDKMLPFTEKAVSCATGQNAADCAYVAENGPAVIKWMKTLK